MHALLASVPQSLAESWQNLNMSMLLSVASSCVTGYFWLIKMNQERTGLRLYRLADFRPDRLQCCDAPGKEKATWYGEILLANPSILPRAVLRLQVELFWKGCWLPGQLVLERRDGTASGAGGQPAATRSAPEAERRAAVAVRA